MSLDYLKDPGEISRRSAAIVRAETGIGDRDDAMSQMMVRLVHACGMPEIAGALAHAGDPAAAGRAALARGAPILCDAAMVAAGITRRWLPAGNAVICRLDDPRTAGLAQAQATTRSAAAVDLWTDDLAGAVVAIGNAPTALFRLLERLDAGAPRPAVILGFPVGFVGAAESKAALAADPRGVPFITLAGRPGGSALAAAAVNALTAGAPG